MVLHSILYVLYVPYVLCTSSKNPTLPQNMASKHPKKTSARCDWQHEKAPLSAGWAQSLPHRPQEPLHWIPRFEIQRIEHHAPLNTCHIELLRRGWRILGWKMSCLISLIILFFAPKQQEQHRTSTWHSQHVWQFDMNSFLDIMYSEAQIWRLLQAWIHWRLGSKCCMPARRNGRLAVGKVMGILITKMIQIGRKPWKPAPKA